MFRIAQRASLIIYMSSFKSLPTIKRYGEVKYVSTRMRYVVLFLDQKQVKKVSHKLMRLKSVKKVLPSSLFRLSQSLIYKTIKELPNEDHEI